MYFDSFFWGFNKHWNLFCLYIVVYNSVGMYFVS